MIKNRKFKLAIGFTLLIAYFFVFQLLTAEQFMELSKWALTGYLGANVGHRAVEVAVRELTKEKE